MSTTLETRRPLGLLVVLFTLSGCVAPQLDALQRDLKVDPRERVRTYDSCKARSRTPADLDSCMKGEGYKFVSASDQDYQASDCWNDVYAGHFPKAYCYDKGEPKQ